MVLGFVLVCFCRTRCVAAAEACVTCQSNFLPWRVTQAGELLPASGHPTCVCLLPSHVAALRCPFARHRLSWFSAEQAALPLAAPCSRQDLRDAQQSLPASRSTPSAAQSKRKDEPQLEKNPKQQRSALANLQPALGLIPAHALHGSACADLFSHVAWLSWMGLFASALVFAPGSPN